MVYAGRTTGNSSTLALHYFMNKLGLPVYGSQSDIDSPLLEKVYAVWYTGVQT